MNTELARLYLQRLVSTLVPPDCDIAFIHGVVSDVLLQNSKPTDRPLTSIMDDYKALFSQPDKLDSWESFKQMVHMLTKATLPQLTANYLMHIAQLNPQQTQTTSSGPKSPNQQGHKNTLTGNGPFETALSTMADTALLLIEPLDSMIIAALLLTLVGQETGVFIFLDDHSALSIPASIGAGPTALLTEILEAALLYRGLAMYLDSAKGTIKSPIKTAFLRFTESFLLRYSNDLDELFQSRPTSLILILNAVEPQIKLLRILNYFRNYSLQVNGFDLLSKTYDLSQFGDPDTSQFTIALFNEIVRPYYQYIEHWTVKGELIDEDNEFFVLFDKSKSHINDIVQFNVKLLPKFLGLEEDIFEKILQIGKTIIFLKKYCNELAWTNNFSSRYYNFLFMTHSGLISMSTDIIRDMIKSQFDELTNFFTAVVHSKMQLYLHLCNLKRIMFAEAGDFIDSINSQGCKMFGEPAIYLTPSRLSDLLNVSISTSSVANLPPQYVARIDDRILDLSHGTIGWDVFTLEYKVPEVPLDALLNYQNSLTEYLRLFNFLWGLRHFTFMLQQSFVLYQWLQKNELQVLFTRTNTAGRPGFRSKWVSRSVKTINLMRHKLLLTIQAILRYVSFDLVEKSFNEEIIKKLFRLKNPVSAKPGTLRNMPILNKAFLQMCQSSPNLTGCETAVKIVHNMTDCTLDEMVTSHKNYLHAITSSKLLKENMRGHASGESLVDQVYGFLEITFSFVQAADQFESTLTLLAGLLRMDPQMHAEEDIDEKYRKLEDVMAMLVDLYKRLFLPKLEVFRRDLRAESNLRDLSKSF